ncbi:MAG: ABC transporter substrate-binding protein [Casimicrobiaceae bacterium]
MTASARNTFKCTLGGLMKNLTLVGAVIVAWCASGGMLATRAQNVPAADIDRSASLRFVWLAAPGGYDPALSKNQFQDTPYMFPVYDGLVRLDAKGNVVPALATSWTSSADGKTLTFQVRPGVQFTDGSDVTAAVIAKNLNRTKKDPASLMSSQLRSFDSFEAPNATTVIAKLNAPDPNAIYALATSAGMVASGKALDSGVNLSLTPVGSGPYKVVSSGPQGATYERNEAYFDKSQNQFAKVTIAPIVEVTSRLNAVQTGQADAALLQADQQSVARVDAMVKSGKFTAHKVLQPNNIPLWFNTKIKPFDNAKVRMAMTLAIDREGISQGITNGECKPAGQPLPPGFTGHDDSLKAPAPNIAKAKQLLQEAGVGPFSFDALVSTQEPVASVGLAIKAQLQALGITMNIIPTPGSTLRPMFRAGNHGAMIMTVSAPSPDPATIIDGFFLSPDNPGGVSPEFANAVAAARLKPLGSPDREVAYKAISRMAYDDPRQIYVCWNPIMVVARKGIVGIEQQAYLNAVPIPDIRTYGALKGQ